VGKDWHLAGKIGVALASASCDDMPRSNKRKPIMIPDNVANTVRRNAQMDIDEHGVRHEVL